MASRRIDALTPKTQEAARAIIEGCRARGVELLVYCTLRTCVEQAKLYRKSRTRVEINNKIAKLQRRGFDALAAILRGVGPQAGAIGRHVTFAGPGESFHNFGDAFDGVPMIDGKPDWSGEHPEAWEVYGEEAGKAGLVWAGTWTRFRELPHCQFGQGGNPLKVFEPDAINNMLKQRGTI